jgi:hypothetical protein
MAVTKLSEANAMILLLGSEPVVRSVMRKVLEGAGYTLRSAFTAAILTGLVSFTIHTGMVSRVQEGAVDNRARQNHVWSQRDVKTTSNCVPYGRAETSNVYGTCRESANYFCTRFD